MNPADEAPPAPASMRSSNLLGLGLIAGCVAVYLPILSYMAQHWLIDDDYSHGFVVAPLALYLAYQRRARLSAAAVLGSWWGLAPLSLGALSLAIGRLGVELMSMRVGFVLTLIGLVLMLFGREVFKILAFPLAFLFLMVPLPNALLNVIAFPLQLVAARSAVEMLHRLGIPALLEGNIIHLANAELFVAEACSGLRSVMGLVTLGVVFAYFFRRRLWERILIVASTLPIAILVNALRVGLTGILTHRFGEEAAGGFIHDSQGMITFVLAFFVLLLEARALSWLSGRGPVAAPPAGRSA